MTMPYRLYGKNGPMISRLGFGAMRLPMRRYGGKAVVNYTRSAEVMRACLEAGVNFFDSHHDYYHGDSETAIGKAIKGWKGGPIIIQTKTPWYMEEKREYFERQLYGALERLGVNTIDYFLHHAMTMDAWKRRGKGFIKFTDWALNRGLIRHRGFSSHETPEHVKEFVDTGEFSVMLVSYNWVNPNVRSVIQHAASKGMGVTVMNPAGGGVLATPTPQVRRLLPSARSAAEIAFRFVLDTPGVACALSGMNSLDQVEENVRIASRKRMLTPAQRQTLKTRLRKIERKSRQFCAGCGYCMPCEHGVDIPLSFQLLNRVNLFGHLEWARKKFWRMQKHKDGDRSPEACVQCGKCLPKCPNHVPIVAQLELARKLFS